MPGTTWTNYYLSSGGHASSVMGDGQLVTSPPTTGQQPDTDWTAKLVDVHPDGTAVNLIRAGHRIRLEISSSDFPQFDPNPTLVVAGGVAGITRRR